LGDTARLEDVRAELGEIEAIAREIDDLTAVLRARLTPGQFRLAWALRDAVERLAVAEGLLRERRLADDLARHLLAPRPPCRRCGGTASGRTTPPTRRAGASERGRGSRGGTRPPPTARPRAPRSGAA
jgi:hypothetical protein